MNPEEIIIADIVLNQFIYGSPRTWNPDTLFAWVRENQSKFTESQYLELSQQNPYKLFNKIRHLLLTENYIETFPGRDDKDLLTKKGKITQELGGHNNYSKWEKRQITRKNIEWFILYIFIPVVAACTLIFTLFPLKHKEHPINNHPTTNCKYDSSKNNHPKRS